MSWGDVLGVAPTTPTSTKAPVSSGWASALGITSGASAPAAPPSLIQSPTPVQQMLNDAAPSLGSTKTTTATTGGPDTREILAGIAQGFARDAAQVGISVGNIIKPSTIGSSIPTSDFTIGGKDWGSILFGKEPLEGLADVAARNETILKKLGFGGFSTPVGVLGAVLPPALDATGLGIGEKVVAKAGLRAAEEVAPKVVSGINTELPRHLLVSGDSAETKIPFANDYRESIPIEAGKVPKDTSGLPTIPLEPGAAPKSEFKYEPVRTRVPTPEAISEPVRTPIPAAETGGDSVAKAASDINAQFVNQGMRELVDSELAKFTSTTKEEQLARVTQLLEDQAHAKEMALGNVPIPEGVKAQVLFNAVKNKALAQGDFQTLKELAGSPLASERSIHAQELGAAGFNNVLHDPVQAMREVTQARTNAGLKRLPPKKVTAQIKRAIRQEHSKQTWESFINSIEC